MERIQHKHVQVGGLKLHVADIGTGPVVVMFLHGFPEIWYSLRHQMVAAANAGYCAIAPDWRGYGLSEQPPEVDKSSFVDLVSDILGILDSLGISKVLTLDSLGISKVFLVGKDFGARPAYQFTLFHPERVLGVITSGVPFVLSGPQALPFELLPSGFYILRWQEPGRAEADFGRFDVKTVIRNIYILFSGSELPVAREDQEIMDVVDPSTPLPPWFTDDDLNSYSSLYEKSGFHFPLQVPYRSWMGKSSDTDPKVQVPVLLIMGGKDYVLKFPGMEDYIKSGKMRDYVPELEITFLPEGTHFVQEQLPEEVNHLIIKFLNNHK